MCILALFSKLSVVCLVLSGPKGTNFFNCSKYSRSLARLQAHKHRVNQHTFHQQNSGLHKQTRNGLSTLPWSTETNVVPHTLIIFLYWNQWECCLNTRHDVVHEMLHVQEVSSKVSHVTHVQSSQSLKQNSFPVTSRILVFGKANIFIHNRKQSHL